MRQRCKSDNKLTLAQVTEWLRAHGITSYTEYERLYKSGELPEGMPLNPKVSYKTDWDTVFGRTNGPRRSLQHKGELVPYEEAHVYVSKLGYTNREQWREFYLTGKVPPGIPYNPAVYGEEFKNFSTYLSTKKHQKKRTIQKYWSFKKARKFVRNLGLMEVKDWNVWAQTAAKPKGIPFGVHHIYKDHGWVSWGDFLGTDVVAAVKKPFLSYDDFKAYVRGAGIKTSTQYYVLQKAGKLTGCPASPRDFYEDAGWTTWGECLGTFSVSLKEKTFDSYESAREYVQAMGIRSYTDWARFRKNRPDYIPAAPDRVYKDSGWAGWPQFTGFTYTPPGTIEEIKD